MRSRTLAAVLVVSTVFVGAPGVTSPAAAQTGAAVATALPVVLWAVTGAVLGAVAWPMIVGGSAAAAAAPGVVSASSFLNTGAAVGTLLGGTGYMMTR